MNPLATLLKSHLEQLVEKDPSKSLFYVKYKGERYDAFQIVENNTIKYSLLDR